MAEPGGDLPMPFRSTTAIAIAFCCAVASAPRHASGDVLDDVAERGVIRFGHRSDAPPFSHLDEAGAPAGLAVALCRTVAAEAARRLDLPDLAVEFHPVTAATRFDALLSGEIDLLCGPSTQTLERRERLDFSIPYFIDAGGAVMRAGLGARLSALENDEVGVLAGTTTENIVRKMIAERKNGLVLKVYDSHVTGLVSLMEGDIAAYFGDAAILRYQLGRLRPITPVDFAREQYSVEPYALAMKRGESRLRLLVDRALSETYASGEIEGMIAATLGQVELSPLARSVYDVVMLPR